MNSILLIEEQRAERAPIFATLLSEGLSKGLKPYLDKFVCYVGKISAYRRISLYTPPSDKK
jgi:hypothetical protein